MEDSSSIFKTITRSRGLSTLIVPGIFAWVAFIINCIGWPSMELSQLLTVCQGIAAILTIFLGICGVIRYGGQKQWMAAVGILLAWANILALICIPSLGI